MSQVLELVSLQAIDSEAASLRASLGDVERRLEGDEELAAARTNLRAVQVALAGLRTSQRKLEASVQDLSARITKDEGRLYDGSIKSPKELGSLQHEVDSFQVTRAGVEEQLLELLGEVESTEETERLGKTNVASLEARWEAQSGALRAEAERLKAAVVRVEASRGAQAALITPPHLRLYESLRNRRGMAVARVTGALCAGCRVTIPDGMRRGILATHSLTQCPNCEPILTVG